MLRLRSKRIGSLLASSLPLSAPRNTTSLAPALRFARSSTSESDTPVHSAVLTAPTFHCSPSTRGLSSERPFPAHSRVTNWPLGGHFHKVTQTEAQRPLDQANYIQTPA